MTIFDLLLILAVLASVVALAAAIFSALKGDRARCWSILRILAVVVVAYLATGVAVSFWTPQRVLRAGDPWCFDDWCLAVENVTKSPSGNTVAYSVDLRIFSRAAGISQRARGAWIYLIDQAGRRYSPEPDASAVPLDVLLGPNQAITTSRTFRVPAGIHNLGLITGHGSPYCLPEGILIIGSGGCLFGKPTLVKLPG